MRARSSMLVHLFALACATAVLPQAAAALDDAGRYARCIAQVPLNPDAALEAALAWRGEGGGPAAEHCIALALIELEHFGEGAHRLETLAAAQGAHDNDTRAELLSQAGNAYLLGGLPEAAIASFDRGIETAREGRLAAETRARLFADRARAHLLSGDESAALEDLAEALAHRRSAEPLVLRARLYRLAGKTAAAETDLGEALRLSPGHAEAHLERGHLRAGLGRRDSAREDFLLVLTTVKSGPILEEARRALATLDLSAP